MWLLDRIGDFPKVHLVGIVAVSVGLCAVALWPSSPDNMATPVRYTIDIPESAPLPPEVPELNWQYSTVNSGDSLSTLFSRNGLRAADVLEIANIAPREAIRLQPGQQIQWVVSNDNRIQHFRIQLSPLAQHAFERNNEGQLAYQLVERDADHLPRVAHVTINNSLFLDGARADIPESILIEMAGLFGWDIDFAQDIRDGDSFSIIYEEVFLDGEKIGDGNILIARFINRGREITAIRYEDSKGISNYFTPEGASMRKEFLRNPIDAARISSRFNPNRRHPVLNTIRAHRGTDYAAPTGTPIKSTGDGRIVHAGSKGGYGNTVIIQHGSRYQTLYAHMSRFHRNTRVGRNVKQGQIIGYVGSTGLATGPHLHYEFLADGVHRDSLRVALPKASALPNQEKDTFTQHATHLIDWLNSASVDSTALVSIDE